MPLIRTIQINDTTKVGIWKITEPESYFLSTVYPQKEIKHPQKRVQHLAGRKLLKALEPGFPIEKIERNERGRPYLPGDDFYFSITHSGVYAAVIIGKKEPVGIDIECVSSRIRGLVPKFLNEKEFNGLPDDLFCYTLSWSAKEAVYKWYGEKETNMKRHIFIKPFDPAEKGCFEAVLDSRKKRWNLRLHYEKFAHCALVWLESKKI